MEESGQEEWVDRLVERQQSERQDFDWKVPKLERERHSMNVG